MWLTLSSRCSIFGVPDAAVFGASPRDMRDGTPFHRPQDPGREVPPSCVSMTLLAQVRCRSGQTGQSAPLRSHHNLRFLYGRKDPRRTPSETDCVRANAFRQAELALLSMQLATLLFTASYYCPKFPTAKT